MTELGNLIYFKDKLLVYNNIKENKIFKNFIELLKTLKSEDSEEKLIKLYYKFSSELIKFGEKSGYRGSRSPWQNLILEFILKDENIFTFQIGKYRFDNIGISLRNAVKNDLFLLEKYYRVDENKIKKRLKNKLVNSDIELPGWNNITEVGKRKNLKREEFFKILDKISGWGSKVRALAEFYRKNGTGILNNHIAFYWDKKLIGIKNMDMITLKNIIGYKKQIEQVKKNTQKLLNGNRANNILLYGEKGTGKSSTVKAIVNEYWDRGLRLLELKKEDFLEFDEIIQRLSNSNLYFILFIDDLSFSQVKNEYRDLKATLEGRTKLLPKNVVIYATSNRRHLVKEDFSGKENELRKQDSIQEKLSLADRFGITIIYTTPDQKKYLKIVKELARQRNLELEENQLIEKAKKWERKQNGRSGRTARQFIDYLEGELEIKKINR
ncbi:MAG: ATP-binding protein [Bacillota bacterium]